MRKFKTIIQDKLFACVFFAVCAWKSVNVLHQTTAHLVQTDGLLASSHHSADGNICADEGGPCLPLSVMEQFQKLKFPSAIIIGSRKAGTKALITMLSAHPEISSMHNEAHYFDDNQSYALGNEWYRSQGPENCSKIVIEKTPGYFVKRYVPRRVLFFNPETKLILLLRNPVDRLISDYAQLQANRKARQQQSLPPFGQFFIDRKRSTLKEITPVIVGKYAQHLKEWLKYFPKRQILVLNGDQLLFEPLSVLRKTEEFLNATPYFNHNNVYFNKTKGHYCWLKDSVPACLGKDKGRAHPQVPTEEIKVVQSYYKPHNERLYKLLGYSFSWDKTFM